MCIFLCVFHNKKLVTITFRHVYWHCETYTKPKRCDKYIGVGSIPTYLNVSRTELLREFGKFLCVKHNGMNRLKLTQFIFHTKIFDTRITCIIGVGYKSVPYQTHIRNKEGNVRISWMFEYICSDIAARLMILRLLSAAFSAEVRGCFSKGSDDSRSFVASSAYTASAWVPTLSSPLRSRRLRNCCISCSDKLRPQLIYRYYSSWAAFTMKREAVNCSESREIFINWHDAVMGILVFSIPQVRTSNTALLQTL